VASLLRQALDSTPAIGAIAPDRPAAQPPGSTAGARLGHYRLGALIGEGGMGEVVSRARRDARARRAIKILPLAFVADADRRARFEREARVLASFNHPHIAAIYGVVDGEGRRGLVLELVEGETLAERLERAAVRGAAAGLPIPEAVGIRAATGGGT
jgi:serine/threonine protein kinase